MSDSAPGIEIWPIERLRPYERNAKRHPQDQIEAIAESMREFQFTAPILVDRDGMILAGHGRHLAALHLGRTEVPVVQLGHLDPAQARAYILADNRLAESAWDRELLAVEFAALEDAGYDLSLTGFERAEIDQLLGGWDSKSHIAEETDAHDQLAPGLVKIIVPAIEVEVMRSWVKDLLRVCPVEGVRLL